jgi:hypothetical protein
MVPQMLLQQKSEVAQVVRQDLVGVQATLTS